MKKKKKPLDKKWVNEMIGFILGPNMAIMMMQSPKSAKELTTIIQGAVFSLYEDNEFEDTNAWVVSASNRAMDLYNTYITARLMKMFDDGVPDKPIIHLAPGSGLSN